MMSFPDAGSVSPVEIGQSRHGDMETVSKDSSPAGDRAGLEDSDRGRRLEPPCFWRFAADVPEYQNTRAPT